MITNILTAVQLVIVIFSLLLVLYDLMKGDNKTSTYLGLLFNACLLWLTVI